VVGFLLEVAEDPRYGFLSPERRAVVQAAAERGVDCILKCQIVVDGKRTAWCAQHDEIDLAPRKGRWHELPSISGAESVSIVRLLMSIERPKPEVVEAVNDAVAWLERSRIKGYRIVVRPEPTEPGRRREAVADANAPDVWARMYDIATNQPLVSDMDSVPHVGLEKLGYGRPGYNWCGPYAARLLAAEYPAWKAKRQAVQGAKVAVKKEAAGIDPPPQSAPKVNVQPAP